MPTIQEPVSRLEENLHREKLTFLGMKFLETIWSLTCCALHVLSALEESEPTKLEIFCAIYVICAIVSFLKLIFIGCGCCKIHYRSEEIISLTGFMICAVSGFITMYRVEQDIHMQYLTDKEEWYHKFFVYSRFESIFAMQTSGLFLIHGVLVLDLTGELDKIFGKLENGAILENSNNRDAEAYRRLQLNPFWISALKWFQHVVNSIASIRRTNSEQRI
ncbi:uncharacterized protein LOC129730762 [Wyeomyia smithii]|uniref:uncharacterized protein LOC129730762 n=1 Tax=Wyeomyia smithii TaxID=174621 RepID=UPI002467F6F7|nr:uncharacterized protein LOC129730762 [Wyeomyia smithii]